MHLIYRGPKEEKERPKWKRPNFFLPQNYRPLSLKTQNPQNQNQKPQFLILALERNDGASPPPSSPAPALDRRRACVAVIARRAPPSPLLQLSLSFFPSNLSLLRLLRRASEIPLSAHPLLVLGDSAPSPTSPAEVDAAWPALKTSPPSPHLY